MQNVIALIVIGFLGYLIFSGKGGMGCCGSHGNHTPDRNQKGNTGRSSHEYEGDVVDLSKDDYSVLPAKDDGRSRNE